MLLELHVRNLALIEQADLELGEGLTIFTGETGAGKSILIDSINIALGGKAGQGNIRTGADSAYIELLFAVDDPDKLERIRQLGIMVEDDGVLIVSRRIGRTRSIIKINDETVTSSKMRSLTGLLIDMHGQFEHQSLMYPARHLEYVDKMMPAEGKELKQKTAALYKEYETVCGALGEGIDSALRLREADILRYEINEILEAELKEGEEEELLTGFRKMKNSSRISSALAKAAEYLDSDEISYAVREASEAAAYDDGLADIKSELTQIEDMVSDVRRNIGSYIDSLDYDEEEFTRIEERLDKIHRLQGKYGDDIRKILEQAALKQERLEYLDNYDSERALLMKRKQSLEEQLDELCSKLTAARRATAGILKGRIVKELEDLNFLGVNFEIEIKDTGEYRENGRDEVNFLISTNPGHPVKPLKDVASGGELSRIMLALKTVLADTDEIETLVFDEIDAGISGVTAQRVAEKLSIIGGSHQVLCITHLPQIAAMADRHYLIRKAAEEDSTRTDISEITGEDIDLELARLISGSNVTETSLKAAGEMKRLADMKKAERN